MPVSKEYSVVADSTLSLSPPPTSPAIKRAAITYGRRRAAGDVESVLSHSAGSSMSHQRVYRTGPPDLDEEIPPSSEPACPSPDHDLADDENEATDKGDEDAPSKFEFAWKMQLKALDERDDFDTEPDALVRSDAFHSQEAVASNSMVDLDNHRPEEIGSRGMHNSPVGTESMSSLSKPPTAPNSPLSKTVGLTQRHTAKRTIILDSDSDSGQTKNHISPSTTSPLFLRSTATSRLQSSPTPPTSDVEMSASSKSKSGARKRKERSGSSISGKTVVPLRFDEELISTAGEKTKTNNRAIAKETRRKMEKRVKALPKKEIAEMRRDRLRITADQPVSIPRPEIQNPKYTIQNLFQTLQGQSSTLQRLPSSDPIVQFPSSPGGGLASTSTFPLTTSTTAHIHAPGAISNISSNEQVQKLDQQTTSTVHVTPAVDPSLDSDSDNLPEVGHLLQQEADKKDLATTQSKLLEIKKRALANKKAVEPSDDDDELEIVHSTHEKNEMQRLVNAEAQERKDVKKTNTKLSEQRKKQVTYRSTWFGRQKRKSTPVQKFIDGSSLVAFGSGSKTTGKQEQQSLNQGELNEVLVKRIADVNMKVTRKKEDEWVRMGGKVVSVEELKGETGMSMKDTWKAYAEKGLKIIEERKDAEQADDEDDDGSDEEWTPDMRGSASPAPSVHDGEEEESPDAQEDVTMVNDEDEVAELTDEVDEESKFLPRQPRRRFAVPESDSDGDGHAQPILKASSYGFGRRIISNTPSASDEADVGVPAVQLSSMLHRTSLSSLDEPTDDEGNKENNTRLMYDRSEDKENKAVVRHHVSGRTLFGARGRLSVSPGDAETRSDDGDDEKDENGAANENRKPFKELLDDPFTSLAGANDSARATVLPQASSTVFDPFASSSRLQPSPNLTPQFVGYYENSEFSQFPDDEDTGISGGNENAPLSKVSPLQARLSDLFEFGTEKQNSGTSLHPSLHESERESLSERHSVKDSALDRLRKPQNLDNLPLTLDVGLQPALEVNENLRREAESIFDKEQGYLLEAANKKPDKRAELYVNDYGFLTQTRPDVSSPEIYRAPSPSQAAKFLMTQNIASARPQVQPPQRHPLRTISFSDDMELDASNHASLRRLTKRSVDPPRLRSSMSPSPLKLANAFEVLGRKANTRSVEPMKFEKSEFIEGEAQESDDDEMFGFGSRKKDDEEEDGEDLDKTLDGLVDDHEMDEKTVAAARVLEKFNEQTAEADRTNEKFHMDVVEGKLRVRKRNHGVGLDDSDDEDSDSEESRKIRQAMNKKQKIDRDNIKALGENEETRSFYNVYEHGLADDDSTELAYLQEPQDIVIEDENEEVEEPRGIITTDEVRRIAQEVARQGQVVDTMDPNDVSWLDDHASEDEDIPKIKEVTLPSRKRGSLLVPDVDGNFELQPRKPTTEDDRERTRMQSWAKIENRSRHVGTGRSTAGAAVTGHSKAKIKTGGGSLRHGQHSQLTASTPALVGEEDRGRAASSVLARVGNRSARFESG